MTPKEERQAKKAETARRVRTETISLVVADQQRRKDATTLRLEQAEQLLREMGYVPGPDGKWKRPD